DFKPALHAIADYFRCDPWVGAARVSASPARGQISPVSFAQSLAALLPEDAIIADESITFGRSVFSATHHSRKHDWLQLTGGAIGSGMPLATGAAIAAPDRRVVNLQADGSGLYTVQAL